MQFYCRKEGLSLEKGERFLRLNVKFNVKPDLFFMLDLLLLCCVRMVAFSIQHWAVYSSQLMVFLLK